jgi:hypothetical protein
MTKYKKGDKVQLLRNYKVVPGAEEVGTTTSMRRLEGKPLTIQYLAGELNSGKPIYVVTEDPLIKYTEDMLKKIETQ